MNFCTLIYFCSFLTVFHTGLLGSACSYTQTSVLLQGPEPAVPSMRCFLTIGSWFSYFFPFLPSVSPWFCFAKLFYLISAYLLSSTFHSLSLLIFLQDIYQYLKYIRFTYLFLVISHFNVTSLNIEIFFFFVFP